MFPFILNSSAYFKKLYLSLCFICFIHSLYYFLFIFMRTLTVCTLVEHINDSISEAKLVQVVIEVLKQLKFVKTWAFEHNYVEKGLTCHLRTIVKVKGRSLFEEI